MPASRLRREQEHAASGPQPNPPLPSIESQRAENVARVPEPQTAEAPVSHAPTPASFAHAPAAAAAATAPATEADGVAAAALAMSEAFRSMLALMERLRPRATPDDERRLNRARREEDILADHFLVD
jgi:hypothetical protein